LERRIDTLNVGAKVTYGATLAGALARAPHVPRDSALRVLARTRAELDAARGHTQALRTTMLALEAAVLYRLGDLSTADRLIAQLRERDPAQAGRLTQRRMLREHVNRVREPAPVPFIALWAGKWLEPLLFSQKVRDPLVFGVVAAVLLVVAIAATLQPAWRATRVDPTVALRSE
jgi:hypothetical protein